MSKSATTRFNPPPNWPLKKNFKPPTNWQPDPAWGPPPQGWPLYVTSQPKSHKVRNAFGLVVGVVVVIIIAENLSGGGGNSSSTAGSTPSVSAAAATTAAAVVKSTPTARATQAEKASASQIAKPSAAAAGIGTKVSVGDFDYVVQSFKCGAKSVGGEFDSTKASGQFCMAKLSVTNHGNDAKTFDDDSQYLYSATGQKYSVSDDADITIQVESNASVLDQINPGVTVQVTIAFDVPATGFVPNHLALVSGLGFMDTPVNVNVS